MPEAPRTLRGVLTMSIEFAGELPAASVELPALPGSFDSEFASLREANSPLRMTSSHKFLHRWHVLQLVMSFTLRTLYFFNSAEPKSI
jgi:hypothetical protein